MKKAYLIHFRYFLDLISDYDIIIYMKTKHAKTLELIFSHPASGNVRWNDVLALLAALGAKFVEAEGSRVGVRLFNDRRVFHRPHPSSNMDKGAVANLREWLRTNGVTP
jgi:hypothetical protein